MEEFILAEDESNKIVADWLEAHKVGTELNFRDMDIRLFKAQAKKLVGWLEGWCEHTTNPLQRRYLCKACRQSVLKSLE